MKNLKQAILIRKDLQMGAGKAATQAAHASIGAITHNVPIESTDSWVKTISEWIQSGQKKICLRVNSEAELRDIATSFSEAGVPCTLITDSGKTEFHGVPTLTALGIGPATDEEIDKFTKRLKLY